jgi:truncated hemoglobin YjbI
MASPPTLYEWAGGSEAFSRMTNAFYDRVEQDELLQVVGRGLRLSVAGFHSAVLATRSPHPAVFPDSP